MSRFIPLCLLIAAFSSLAIAQDSASSAAAPTQVVYLIGSSTITTYNVDPQTLYATQVGNPLTVSATNLNYYTTSVTPSSNDRVLYIIGSESSTSPQHLMVYGTDSSGIPQGPSLQTIRTTGLGQVMTNPKSSFLYALFENPGGNSYYSRSTIHAYEVDAQGELSDGKTVATYKLPNGAEGTEVCTLSILGFNAAGTELYDEVYCVNHEGIAATYSERSVDLETGALGPDVEIYSWNDSAGGYYTVQIVGDHVFVFETPNDYQTGLNSVDVFALAPNVTTPLVQCTASMLESCGYATGTTHPSGKYIFMSDTGTFTEIDRVEPNGRKIVDTGNYIPYGFGSSSLAGQFSPDGTIVYATQPLTSGYNIEIYGFDVATSEVTPGGVIAGSEFDLFLATQRD